MSGTYTAVETADGVVSKDVHEGAEHAFGAIWSAGLKADLLTVSEEWGERAILRDIPLLQAQLASDRL